jgi:hypothetical protein
MYIHAGDLCTPFVLVGCNVHLSLLEFMLLYQIDGALVFGLSHTFSQSNFTKFGVISQFMVFITLKRWAQVVKTLDFGGYSHKV